MNRPRCLLPLALLGAACSSPSERPPAPGTGEAVSAGTGAPPNETNLVAAYVVLEGPSGVGSVAPGASFGDPAVRAVVQDALARARADQAALRAKLEPMGVVVDFQLQRLLNALQVRATPHALSAIAGMPEVRRVDPVTTFYPSLQSAVPAVGAPEVWDGMPPATGAGMRIGIVDSGIDYTHADLGGSGDPAAHANNDPTLIEPGTFPTGRVIGGFDFVGDDYDPQTPGSIAPDPDPLDCFNTQSIQVSGGHGTHVSGIAAGNGVLANGSAFAGPYEQSLDPLSFRVAPGVAPEASLYALKIFGCSGGTNALAVALERAADPNQDGDLTDRLDVVNASLGSAYGFQNGSEAEIVQNLDAAGTLLVVAAGNDGASFFAVGSPAVYPQALAVAASADNNFLALHVTSPQAVAGDYPAAEGGFTVKLTTTGPITGAAVLTSPSIACSSISNGDEVEGNIAIIDRGECTFAEKFERASDAGAIAVVVVDNEESAAPFSMGGGDGNESSIPGVMIRRVHGELLKDALDDGVVITLDAGDEFEGLSGDLYADFSSRGPSAWDGRLKPEIAAPGFSIDSARVASGTEARRSQGTSMACPMVAGAAALVRQAYPERSPAAVKAVLMNTAADFADLDGNPYAVSMVGAGRLEVSEAVGRTAYAHVEGDEGMVAVSFGDFIVDEPTSAAQTVVVQNDGDDPITFDLSAALTFSAPGVTVDVSPPVVTVAPSDQASVELTLSVDPEALGAPGPDPVTPAEQFENARHWLVEPAGHLSFVDRDGAQTLRVPFHATARAAARRHAGTVGQCGGEVPNGEVEIPIEGDFIVDEPVITAFELGELHKVDGPSASNAEYALRDLRAVGAASSAATTDVFGETSISFGVGIVGQWQTAAQGQISLVGIAIDRDMDAEADFVIFAEPLTRDGPYADVLAATTYNLNTGQPTDQKRYLNIVPPSEVQTYPFQNSVVVLSTFAKEIGVFEDSPVFQYYAFTQSRTGFPPGEQTGWIPFNAARPTIDTSRFGTVEGRPIFAGTDPVRIFVDAEAAGGAPLPKVLLLHHTNVAGERIEILDLQNPLTGNVQLSFEPNPAAAPELADLGTLVVANTGADDAAEVEVTVKISGATGVSLSSEDGECAPAPATSCTFAVVEPGASLEIDVRGFADKTVIDAQGRFVVVVEAQAEASGGCDLSGDDNAVAFAVPLTITPDVELSPSGGCLCETGRPTDPSRAPLWALGMAAWVAARRRRSK